MNCSLIINRYLCISPISKNNRKTKKFFQFFQFTQNVCSKELTFRQQSPVFINNLFWSSPNYYNISGLTLALVLSHYLVLVGTQQTSKQNLEIGKSLQLRSCN